MGLPRDLCCPLCQGLMQNAVQLPCCRTAACKACILRKLTANERRCWNRACTGQAITFSDLVVYTAMRMQIEQFKLQTDQNCRKQEKKMKTLIKEIQASILIICGRKNLNLKQQNLMRKRKGKQRYATYAVRRVTLTLNAPCYAGFAVSLATTQLDVQLSRAINAV